MYEIKEGQRPCATFFGVKIYRVRSVIPGSDFRILKSGEIREKRPQYEVAYMYWDSYPYSTLDACKSAIESLKDQFIQKGLCTLKTFAPHLNKE